MSAADKLADIQARADKATAGPWEERQDDLTDDVYVVHDQEHVSHVANIGVVGMPRVAEDTEFIAHARQDVPALVNALQAVLEIADGADKYPDAQGWHLHWVHTEAIRRAIEDALP